MGRYQPRQKVGVNFTGGASALLTDFKKGRTDKRTVIHVDHLSDASTMDRNMHERMTLDKP